MDKDPGNSSALFNNNKKLTMTCLGQEKFETCLSKGQVGIQVFFFSPGLSQRFEEGSSVVRVGGRLCYLLLKNSGHEVNDDFHWQLTTLKKQHFQIPIRSWNAWAFLNEFL